MYREFHGVQYRLGTGQLGLNLSHLMSLPQIPQPQVAKQEKKKCSGVCAFLGARGRGIEAYHI